MPSYNKLFLRYYRTPVFNQHIVNNDFMDINI
jgi:hypothetical protein